MLSTQKFDKPSRSGQKWTDEDHDKLLCLTASTKTTIEDIASELGRTVAAVRSHLLKETYILINQGDWAAEELSARYKLSVSDILRYQEREDEKKRNPPEKRITRSDMIKTQDEPDLNDIKKSFSTVTKNRQVLTPGQNKTLEPKNPNVRGLEVFLPQTYEEKNLILLAEIRDLLRIIADKK